MPATHATVRNNPKPPIMGRTKARIGMGMNKNPMRPRKSMPNAGIIRSAEPTIQRMPSVRRLHARRDCGATAAYPAGTVDIDGADGLHWAGWGDVAGIAGVAVTGGCAAAVLKAPGAATARPQRVQKLCPS
jgi:hypothetical protein